MLVYLGPGTASPPSRRALARPASTPVRVVDARGGPVAGAVVAGSFRKDADREPLFTPEEMIASKTSDERGEVLLDLDTPGRLDGTGVYAIRQSRGRPLVGIRKVTREEIGRPITITMRRPAGCFFRSIARGFRLWKTSTMWSSPAHGGREGLTCD